MKSTILAALCLLTATGALAQTATPAINQRQRNERARIQQGVNNGELTRREATRLRAQQADIRQDKKDAKADGVVTRDERLGIRRDEARASRSIYRQKHDAQTRNRR